MKIYTTKFNANQPSVKQINIPNFSQAKIGVQVEKNGQIVDLSGNEAKLVQGNTVISSDGNYNGFATFPITTGNENEDKNFTLSCDKGYDVNVSQTFTYSDGIMHWCTVSSEIPVGTTVYPEGFTINGKPVYNVATLHLNGQEIAKVMKRDGRKWYVYATGEYLTSYVVQETGVIGRIYNYVMNDTATYAIKIGEQFKSNFKLTVNSDKNTVFDVDKDTVTPSYTLPVASSSTLGGIKVGANLAIASDGTLSASGGGSSMTVEEITLEDNMIQGGLIQLNVQPNKIYKIVGDNTSDSYHIEINPTYLTADEQNAIVSIENINYTYCQRIFFTRSYYFYGSEIIDDQTDLKFNPSPSYYKITKVLSALDFCNTYLLQGGAFGGRQEV